MYVNGRSTSEISAQDIADTFTIQAPPNTHQTQLFVNVPLLGVSEKAPETEHIAGHAYPAPNVIVFKFEDRLTGK